MLVAAGPVLLMAGCKEEAHCLAGVEPQAGRGWVHTASGGMTDDVSLGVELMVSCTTGTRSTQQVARLRLLIVQWEHSTAALPCGWYRSVQQIVFPYPTGLSQRAGGGLNLCNFILRDQKPCPPSHGRQAYYSPLWNQIYVARMLLLHM